MASERQHLASICRAAIALSALLIGTELRSRTTDGGRNGVQGMARSLAHEFEATTDLELGEQGRDMEFHGAFGEIQLVGNFLVSANAKTPIEKLSRP